MLFRQNKKNIHIFILFKSIWIFCNICKWVHRLSSVWKVWSQNHTVNVGKGSNTQKCWKTKSFVGPEGFFWRPAGSSTVQDKQGTHEQLSLNKQTAQTAVDHSGNKSRTKVRLLLLLLSLAIASTLMQIVPIVSSVYIKFSIKSIVFLLLLTVP